MSPATIAEWQRCLMGGAGAVFCLAFLLPNHYYPWATFWQDLTAAVAAALVFWSVAPGLPRSIAVPRSAVFVGVLAMVPLVQAAAGQVFYFGDAFIAALYLIGLALMMTVPSMSGMGPAKVLMPTSMAVLAAAIASVGLAGNQWLGVGELGIFAADMAPGGRPFANLAQPNQLATVLMLGVVVAAALFEARALTAAGFALAVAWLLFGLAMTQSRTAWLQMVVMLGWWLWACRSGRWRIRPVGVIVIATMFGLFVLWWPWLCEALLLTPARTLADQTTTASGRLNLWLQMLDAIGHKPLWGYGWNQTSVAQIRVAADHPPSYQWIEDSHNLILELCVMQGLPLGLLTVALLGLWLWRCLRRCRDAMTGLAISAVLVVAVHAMLEFPLDYAYVLLPIGLAVGYIEARLATSGTVALTTRVLLCAACIVTVLLARVVVEYADVETRNRAMRFELAGFGPSERASVPTPVHLLTQLEELPWFASTLARRDMPPEELERMRMMAERFAYPPVLFRYGLAAALNGEPATASRMLQVLCHVHPPQRCEEGLVAWRQMSAVGFPELRAVPWPAIEAQSRNQGSP